LKIDVVALERGKWKVKKIDGRDVLITFRKSVHRLNFILAKLTLYLDRLTGAMKDGSG